MSTAGLHHRPITSSLEAATSSLSSGGALGQLYDFAHYYSVGVYEKYGDPRVAGYPLMRTPWPTILLTLIYYSFVRSIGPRVMRDKKAYEILPLIRIYNLGMAMWNCFGFVVASQLLNYGFETLGCQPADPSKRDERTLSQIYYGYMFFTSRLIEFADTVFFVLRKKDSQVSSFHVFHHSSVPTATWFFLKFAPGGNSGIFPYVNTLIHTIMYSYYFLATFPSMRPFLGWKKYLTQLQIFQFLVIIAVSCQPLFIPGCKVPQILQYVTIAFSIIFIYLFLDFYIKSYNDSKRKEKDAAKLQQDKTPAQPIDSVKGNSKEKKL